uniref:Uncharacterized protein n=1 Tax=Opuntia streptacantha TaxID=393608 RepID=A0A7C9EE66_OPUST
MMPLQLTTSTTSALSPRSSVFCTTHELLTLKGLQEKTTSSANKNTLKLSSSCSQEGSTTAHEISTPSSNAFNGGRYITCEEIEFQRENIFGSSRSHNTIHSPLDENTSLPRNKGMLLKQYSDEIVQKVCIFVFLEFPWVYRSHGAESAGGRRQHDRLLLLSSSIGNSLLLV